MFKYYSATAKGNYSVSAPPCVIEKTLIENFHWTFHDIENTPYKKIQELFLVLSQADTTTMAAREMAAKKSLKGKGR